ncbi:uncharacterized protein CCR75_003095 [Bremia lactucae]|uniref:RING-type E3 ubiquitin transferase n=1 Tax=Bremia lactucae TaxID=4779 RepID=A0A976IKR3_BRELC|nr:hypothetical protein CCR75_003095 [Bremia lactucae]
MKPCSFFAAGKCRNGKNCKYVHASHENLTESPRPSNLFPNGACINGRVSTRVVEAGTSLLSDITGNKSSYFHVQEERNEELYFCKANTATNGTSISEIMSGGWEKKAIDTLIKMKKVEKIKEEVTELTDFISNEEELYYYGAPDNFKADVTETLFSEAKDSFLDVTKDGLKTETNLCNGERPAPPYGNTCFYAHSLPEEIVSEEERLATDEEFRLSQGLECGICYEIILNKGEQFGMLSGCNHSFCLTCVRNWPNSEDHPKQTVRQCPACGKETKFIIPTSRMVYNPNRKKVLMDVYRKELNGIPCRHFDGGRKTCPFGTSCYYAHRSPDGFQALRQARTVVDEDGQNIQFRQSRQDIFLKQSEVTEELSR